MLGVVIFHACEVGHFPYCYVAMFNNQSVFWWKTRFGHGAKNCMDTDMFNQFSASQHHSTLRHFGRPRNSSHGWDSWISNPGFWCFLVNETLNMIKHVLYDSWPPIWGSDISKPRDGLWAWSSVWLMLCWSSNFPPEKRNCKFTSRYYWHINTHHALWGQKNGHFRVSEGKPGIDQPPFGSWWSWLMRKEARHPLFLMVLSSDNFFLKSLESLVFVFFSGGTSKELSSFAQKILAQHVSRVSKSNPTALSHGSTKTHLITSLHRPKNIYPLVI